MKNILLELRDKLQKSNKDTRNNVEQQLLSSLGYHATKLQKIDDTYTNHDIDLIVKGSASIPGVLWQEEIMSKYHFFVIFIGVIDGLLDDIKRESTFYSYFCHSEDIVSKMKNLQNQYKEFLEKRRVILDDFKSLPCDGPKFVNEVIEHVPSYEKFSLAYEDIKSTSYTLFLQLEFIDAYHNGYKSAKWVNFETVFMEYQKLLASIFEKKSENEKKVLVQRLLKSQRK